MIKPWILLLSSILPGFASAGSSHPSRAPLKTANDFKTPLEVVQYYCARDAAGFIWNGMTEAERKAFTLWKEAPQSESYWIADQYEITPLQTPSNDQALIEVHYTLSAQSDAHGTHLLPAQKDLRVVFVLKKIKQQWKIEKPGAGEIEPVVVGSSFPLRQAK